jgi:hypothetical protein
MQTTRFTLLSGLALAIMLTLVIGQALVFGNDDDRREPSKLEGTWDITLTFDNCATTPPTPTNRGCSCPPTPDHTVPGLHMYLKNGSFLDAGGGSFFRGPAVGSWKHIGPHQCEVIGPYEFEVRYKFYLFNNDATFSRRGYEEVTNCIHLTGPDTFKAEAIFHFFDANGDETSPDKGCPIHETAQRFE